MKNPLKNNTTFDLLKHEGYTAFYKRDGINASGHPRYNVFLFNKYGFPAGHKNIVSYSLETDIKFLIKEYDRYFTNNLKEKGLL